MSLSVIEMLAIELTKAKIADMDPIFNDHSSAELWYKTYEESKKELQNAEHEYCLNAKINKPTVFD